MVCVASISLEDWVLNAHWLSNGTQLVLITAHNVAWLWTWSESDGSVLQRADCLEKCILYPFLPYSHADSFIFLEDSFLDSNLPDIPLLLVARSGRVVLSLLALSSEKS